MSQTRTNLRKECERLEREIEKIYETGEVAEYGVSVVKYYANNGYEYYKLVAPSQIFDGKNGKKTKTRHLGQPWNNPKVLAAQMSVDRRHAITKIQKQIKRIKALMDEYLPNAEEFRVKR